MNNKFQKYFEKIAGPVTILLYDLECYFLFYMTWIYVELIVEFKNSFGKYLPVCPKILKGLFFSWIPV